MVPAARMEIRERWSPRPAQAQTDWRRSYQRAITSAAAAQTTTRSLRERGARKSRRIGRRGTIFCNSNEHQFRALWRIALQTIPWFVGLVILLLPPIRPFRPEQKTAMESGFAIAIAFQCPAILLRIWPAGRTLDRRR